MSSSSTNAAAGPSRPPVKPPVVKPGSGNAIVINPCQRLNPILECIRNVSKEFGDIVPDFQLGRTTCALYISLKYHRLHPEYVHQRIEKLGNLYSLRILLLMCDISEHQDPIRELTRICLINNMTVMVCWSAEEAGMYLSTYKAFEHKSPDMIKERVDKDYNAILRSALTSINKVNKMDVETLRTSLGSFANVARASPEQLRNLPGFGQVKVRRIKDAFEKPFRNNATSAISSSQRPALPELEADAQIADDEMLGGAETTDQRLLSKAAKRTAHQFGSAASMPPPPVPSRPSARKPSPPWDIELDLVADDGPAPVDPRLAAKKSAADGQEGSEGSTGNGRSEWQERPPSPPWDVDLDLSGEGHMPLLVDPRLANKKRSTKDDGIADEASSDLKCRERPPSPVWDIELDLNDD